MLCLRKGLPTPDPMQLAGQRDAELLYNGGTHVVTLLTEDAELKAMSREQARPWWALAAAILQHGFDRYAAFENGERNGYAVDAHFFAMLCNNLGIALGKLNLHERACQVHERGLLTSPFLENAQNALYEATLTDDAAAARRCSEHVGRFLQDYGNYLDTAQQCRFQSLMLAAAGYSDMPDVWFEKLRLFNQQWGYMRKQARFMNSDEHHLPLEWSYLKREHNQAINDQWRSLKILHKRASQDPRVITCMLRNRRDHASEEARAEGLALAEQALHVLAPLKDTPEGTRYWFEARYSLAYLRYRSWFYQSSVVGQDWLPQARKEFEVVLAQRIEGDPEAIDAMLDYGMLLVREILDLPEGIVWLTRVIQALEPQPRPRGGERRWDPKTAPDPALALAYLFRAQAYSLQDQDLNSSVRSDLEQAGALNPWLPGVWYWMATVKPQSLGSDTAWWPSTPRPRCSSIRSSDTCVCTRVQAVSSSATCSKPCSIRRARFSAGSTLHCAGSSSSGSAEASRPLLVKCCSRSTACKRSPTRPARSASACPARDAATAWVLPESTRAAWHASTWLSAALRASRAAASRR